MCMAVDQDGSNSYLPTPGWRQGAYFCMPRTPHSICQCETGLSKPLRTDASQGAWLAACHSTDTCAQPEPTVVLMLTIQHFTLRSCANRDYGVSWRCGHNSQHFVGIREEQWVVSRRYATLVAGNPISKTHACLLSQWYAICTRMCCHPPIRRPAYTLAPLFSADSNGVRPWASRTSSWAPQCTRPLKMEVYLPGRSDCTDGWMQGKAAANTK